MGHMEEIKLLERKLEVLKAKGIELIKVEREIVVLEKQLETARAKRKLVEMLDNEEWLALSVLAHEECPCTFANKELLLNKIFGKYHAAPGS